MLHVWIASPLVGAVIGYITNRLAVKMIFRPIRPYRVLGVTVQGLMPRRQPDLAQKIGQVVGDHLIDSKDLMGAMEKIDFESVLKRALDTGLATKLDELRRLPLVGSFLTEERVEDLKGHAVRGLVEHKDTLLQEIETGIEDGLDIRSLVTEKVGAFPVERLEQLVLEVADRELRAIEILGAVLGALIGLLQAAVLALLV